MQATIFCPQCHELILDAPTCSNCGWLRPADGHAMGVELWSADLKAQLPRPRCYPIAAKGCYWVVSEEGRLLALDLETGALVREQPLEAGGATHALATDGERLFVGLVDVRVIPTPGRAFQALDARTAHEVWQYSTQGHSLSAGTLVNNVLYFTSSDGLLHAVESVTGQRRWAVEHATWGASAPAVDEERVYVGGRGKSLVAYSVADGAEQWRFSAGDFFAYPPVVAEGLVYALNWDGSLYALETHTGHLLWKYTGERGKGLTCPPAVGDGKVFVGSRVFRRDAEKPATGYAMLALGARDGVELWRCYATRHISAPPAVHGDVLFFGSDDGLFSAVETTRGGEQWQVQIDSRIVTEPRIVGDVVYFGGRDGTIHAVRWRAGLPEVLLAPETYILQGEYAQAAVAYALRGEFSQAASIYETQLNQPREAAQLYERAGQPGRAAALWQSLGNLPRARDLYRDAKDPTALAGVLEQVGEHLEAARLYEEAGNLQEAARLYEQAGDRAKAAVLYSHLGQYDRAESIWESLGQWEQQAEALIAGDEIAEAARLLEAHKQWERAADLYERVERWRLALALRVRLESWERVAELASRLQDYEQEAAARERLGHRQRAAAAYERAAQQATATQAEPERVATLYEQAARLYGEVFDEERAAVCSREVRRHRQLPDVVVDVVAETGFVEYEWNTLKIAVQNNGFGSARQLAITLRGAFDVEGESTLQGLRYGATKTFEVFVRPHKENYGPAVPLEISITYSDLKGGTYHIVERTPVRVVKAGVTPSPLTPLELHLVDNTIQKPQGTVTTSPTMNPTPGRHLGLPEEPQAKRSTGPIKNRWALLVGINRYHDPAFPALQYCVNDVLAMEARLKELGYTVVCMHDGLKLEDPRFPVRDNIEAELERLCQVAEADDLLLVHFACHGTLVSGQPVLVARDTREPTLATRGLKLADVEARMRASAATRLLVFLDACHTGVEVGRSLASAEFIRNAYELAEGFALIAASTAQQVAREWRDKQHGVFTYFLLEGLSGQADRDGDKLITVSDLTTYVLDNLRKWNVLHGGPLQEPTARTEGLGDIIVADLRIAG